jgi:hypothetical protein
MIAVRLLVLLALLAAPLATEAQQAGKVYRVGILSVEAVPSTEDVATSPLRAAMDVHKMATNATNPAAGSIEDFIDRLEQEEVTEAPDVETPPDW